MIGTRIGEIITIAAGLYVLVGLVIQTYRENRNKP